MQENERAPWISMEDTVFSDDDSEVTTETRAAAEYVRTLSNSLSDCISCLKPWFHVKVKLF